MRYGVVPYRSVQLCPRPLVWRKLTREVVGEQQCGTFYCGMAWGHNSAKHFWLQRDLAVADEADHCATARRGLVRFGVGAHRTVQLC